jgi:DNA polymerase V
MGALDSLNQRYGRGTVHMASAGLAGDRRAWSMNQERRRSLAAIGTITTIMQ